MRRGFAETRRRPDPAPGRTCPMIPEGDRPPRRRRRIGHRGCRGRSDGTCAQAKCCLPRQERRSVFSPPRSDSVSESPGPADPPGATDSGSPPPAGSPGSVLSLAPGDPVPGVASSDSTKSVVLAAAAASRRLWSTLASVRRIATAAVARIDTGKETRRQAAASRPRASGGSVERVDRRAPQVEGVSVLQAKRIPNAPNGAQRVPSIELAELSSQVVNVEVHDVRVDVRLRAPHRIEDLLARHHLARRAGSGTRARRIRARTGARCAPGR